MKKLILSKRIKIHKKKESKILKIGIVIKKILEKLKLDQKLILQNIIYHKDVNIIKQRIINSIIRST